MPLLVLAPGGPCIECFPVSGRRGICSEVMGIAVGVWHPSLQDFLPYVASKATLIGVARSLARPLGAHGITVNSMAPG